MYRLCNGDIDFLTQCEKAFIIKGAISDGNFVYNLRAGNFPDRQHYLSHIQRQLRKIITTALNPDPNARYKSVFDFLNDLSKLNTANDWAYSKDSTNEIWVKENYRVVCAENGNNFDIIALKGDRRSSLYSKTVNSIANKNTLLYDCLNSLW